MHRLIFWGIILLIVLLAGILIDQIFWRTLRLLMQRHTAMTIRLVMLGVTVVTIVTTVVYGHYITRLRLQVNEVSVPSARLPQSFDGYRIAHLSDFHIDSFGDSESREGGTTTEGEAFMRNLAQTIQAQKVDMVVFTGDMVTLRSVQAVPWKAMLRLIAQEAHAPVYAILGNHDYADYTRMEAARKRQDRDSLCMILEDAGWKMLNNERVCIKRGNDSIQLVGVENIGEPPFSTYGDLAKAMHDEHWQMSPTYTILLSHNPSHWRREVLPDTQIDLMLAGHTHAMQCRIMGWSPSRYTYHEYSGLYTEGSQSLYVNTGLGCTGPRVRVGVKPELTIISLVSTPQR